MAVNWRPSVCLNYFENSYCKKPDICSIIAFSLKAKEQKKFKYGTHVFHSTVHATWMQKAKKVKRTFKGHPRNASQTKYGLTWHDAWQEVKWLAVKTASEMIYIVSSGALNSTTTNFWYWLTW